MYLQGQVMGHQELLQLHQAMAQSGSRPEERMLATVAVPAIKSHLAMLGGIQQTRS
jgi:putative membrane protein